MKIINVVLKTFKSSFVRKYFLVCDLEVRWSNYWNLQMRKKGEPESFVTCSDFYGKLQHVFLPALSLITLSWKLGMSKVLNLMEIEVFNASVVSSRNTLNIFGTVLPSSNSIISFNQIMGPFLIAGNYFKL